MGKQITIDFDRAPFIDNGKKTERITFTGSSDLKEFLNTFSVKQNLSISELCQKYIIDGLQKDLGMMLLIREREDQTLSSLLKR